MWDPHAHSQKGHSALKYLANKSLFFNENCVMTDMSRYSAGNKRCKGVPVFMMLCMGVDTEGILSIKTGYTATIEIVHMLPSATKVHQNLGTVSQTL